MDLDLGIGSSSAKVSVLECMLRFFRWITRIEPFDFSMVYIVWELGRISRVCQYSLYGHDDD